LWSCVKRLEALGTMETTENKELGICHECSTKDGDSSKKPVHYCDLCNKWFCELHLKPKFPYFVDWETVFDVQGNPVVKLLFYTEYRREDGHPDFEYMRKKTESLNIEEKRRNKLVKTVLDKMNHIEISDDETDEIDGYHTPYLTSEQLEADRAKRFDTLLEGGVSILPKKEDAKEQKELDKPKELDKDTKKESEINPDECSLKTLKEAYESVQITTKKKGLFGKNFHYCISYKDNDKEYSFEYPLSDPNKIFESELNLYRLIDSNMQAIETEKLRQEQEERERIKNNKPKIIYQYRRKRDAHQIVERMWGSNAKTVTTVRNRVVVKRQVLPDNSSEKNYTVQPYKKKHWWQ
jgi:hypothetical protein